MRNPSQARFRVGMKVGVVDEFVATITKVTRTMVYLESDEFFGWATKAELLKADRDARRRGLI